VLIVILFNLICKTLFATIMASGLRARVTVELTGAMLSEIVVLALLLFYLKRRGIGLRQIGLWTRSPARGWIGAAIVAGLFVWFNLALPLRNEQNLLEVSLFHIYNSLVAGLVAGFSEEILFRCFFMTELASAGFGKTAQVMVSAALYGLVHSAWGITSGMFTMEMMGGAIIGTAIFGLFCSIVYLLSGRSLTPIIRPRGRRFRYRALAVYGCGDYGAGPMRHNQVNNQYHSCVGCGEPRRTASFAVFSRQMG
jgi:membrane protease YdiL (CAAX protease family)